MSDEPIFNRRALLGAAAVTALAKPATAEPVSGDVRVEGYCDPRFNGLKDAFQANLASGADVGASVSVVLDGKPVADLWGGYADKARARPWKRDTIVIVASTSKGLTGLCANMLIDRGLLDPDELVTKYWPEYGQNGKEHTKVRWLMDHRAGLPDVAGSPQIFMDWNATVTALAQAKPLWEPGTEHSYHAMTYGFLVGEIVRRVSGKTVGHFLQDEVAKPLHVDAYIGTPSAKDPMIAEVISDTGGSSFLTSVAARRVEMPAGNAHTNGRSLARIYGALARGGEVDGVRLLSGSTLAHATSYCVTGPWHGVSVMAGPTQTSDTKFAQGVVLNSPVSYMGTNPYAFGYAGAGGSESFADPAAKLGFGYAMNRFAEISTRNSRCGRLVAAVYDALGCESAWNFDPHTG